MSPVCKCIFWAIFSCCPRTNMRTCVQCCATTFLEQVLSTLFDFSDSQRLKNVGRHKPQKNAGPSFCTAHRGFYTGLSEVPDLGDTAKNTPDMTFILLRLHQKLCFCIAIFVYFINQPFAMQRQSCLVYHQSSTVQRQCCIMHSQSCWVRHQSSAVQCMSCVVHCQSSALQRWPCLLHRQFFKMHRQSSKIFCQSFLLHCQSCLLYRHSCPVHHQPSARHRQYYVFVFAAKVNSKLFCVLW